MRGLIMVLLALESTGLYEHLINGSVEYCLTTLSSSSSQHHPWHGLHAWDLVQPAFMFMAGTALAFSLHRQQLEGRSWNYSFRKALRRSGWLFFWGVLDYAVRPGGLSFELWDVLTQLSFTSLLAFLIFRWSATGPTRGLRRAAPADGGPVSVDARPGLRPALHRPAQLWELCRPAADE
jgi:hypothetical protein